MKPFLHTVRRFDLIKKPAKHYQNTLMVAVKAGLQQQGPMPRVKFEQMWPCVRDIVSDVRHGV